MARILTLLLKETLNKYPSAFREENIIHFSLSDCVHDQMLSSAICVSAPSSATAFSHGLSFKCSFLNNPPKMTKNPDTHPPHFISLVSNYDILLAI